MEVTSGKRKVTIDDIRRESGTVGGARALCTRLERMGSSTKWRDLIDKGSHSNWRENRICGYRCRWVVRCDGQSTWKLFFECFLFFQ